MKTRRINSLSIQCKADEWGATEHEVFRPGVLFIVTAHCREDAVAAADAALAEGEKADETQPELLP